jgi:hypothetical protein
MNSFKFNKQFTNEIAIIKYFIKLRYKRTFRPEYRAIEKVYHRHTAPRMAHCNNRKSEFLRYLRSPKQSLESDFMPLTLS